MMTCPLISSMRRICSDREPPRAPTLNRVTISCCKWLIRAVIDMLERVMRMMIKDERKGNSPSHLNHSSSSARQELDALQPYCQTTLLSTLVCLNSSSLSLESSKNPNRLHLKGQFAPTMRPNTVVPDLAVTQAEIAIEATSMAWLEELIVQATSICFCLSSGAIHSSKTTLQQWTTHQLVAKNLSTSNTKSLNLRWSSKLTSRRQHLPISSTIRSGVSCASFPSLLKI